METVTKSVSIEFGDATKYVGKKSSEVYTDVNMLGVPCTIILYRALSLGSATGTCTLNSDFMSALYPSETTHPTRFDYSMMCGSTPQNSANLSIALALDGTQLFKDSKLSAAQQVEKVHDNLAVSAVLNSNRQSEFTFTFTLGYTLLNTGVGINSAIFTMYFIKYDMNVSSIGNGVESITKSADELYKGDTVTLTANLKDGAEWHGWYSDANHTNLVSTSQTYTITNANADVTLYAYADKEVKPVIKSATVTPNPVDIGGTVLVSIGVDLE